jgi:hypothetical protein
MLKKLFMLTALVVGGVVILNTTSLGSYLGFSWKKIKDGAKSNVPPEVEIERLKYELTKLEPEVKKNRQALANEIVAVEELKDEIKKMHVKLQKEYDSIMAHKKKVEAGTEFVSYYGTDYPTAKVRELLAADWEAYEAAKGALERKEQLLLAKEASVREARKKLAGWAATREQLEAKLTQIETELRTVRLSETRAGVELDNSKLSNFKKSLGELERRVKVMQTEQELNGEFPTRNVRKENRSESVERAWRAMTEAQQTGENAKVVEK